MCTELMLGKIYQKKMYSSYKSHIQVQQFLRKFNWEFYILRRTVVQGIMYRINCPIDLKFSTNHLSGPRTNYIEICDYRNVFGYIFIYNAIRFYKFRCIYSSDIYVSTDLGFKFLKYAPKILLPGFIKIDYDLDIPPICIFIRFDVYSASDG